MSLFYRLSFLLLVLLVCRVNGMAWVAPKMEPLVGKDGPDDAQQRLRLRVTTYLSGRLTKKLKSELLNGRRHKTEEPKRLFKYVYDP